MAAATDDDEFLVFDALTEDALRAPGSVKWTRYGSAIGAFAHADSASSDTTTHIFASLEFIRRLLRERTAF